MIINISCRNDIHLINMLEALVTNWLIAEMEIDFSREVIKIFFFFFFAVDT